MFCDIIKRTTKGMHEFIKKLKTLLKTLLTNFNRLVHVHLEDVKHGAGRTHRRVRVSVTQCAKSAMLTDVLQCVKLQKKNVGYFKLHYMK